MSEKYQLGFRTYLQEYREYGEEKDPEGFTKFPTEATHRFMEPRHCIYGKYPIDGKNHLQIQIIRLNTQKNLKELQEEYDDIEIKEKNGDTLYRCRPRK